MAAELLSAVHIRKVYDKRAGLNDISLSVSRSEAVALVGENGFVKGALIRALAALRFALWLLPPVYDASAAYSAQDYFSIGHRCCGLPPTPPRRSQCMVRHAREALRII